MKHLKSIIIVLLIASNAYFIWAYQQEKSKRSTAEVIAEQSRAEALKAATAARQAQEEAHLQFNHARQAQMDSEARVIQLENKIAELKK